MPKPIDQNTWNDRIEIKQSLTNWVRSNVSFFLLTVKDNLELEHISNWAEKEFSNYLIGLSFLTTDASASGYHMLNEITEGIGKIYFPKFYKKLAQLSKKDPQIIINQRIGTDIHAKSLVTVDSNQNIVNFKDFDMLSVQDAHLESEVNNFLNVMIDDLVALRDKVLIIVRFQGMGMNSLSPSFRSWFGNYFFRKISQLDHVKVLLLFQGDTNTIREKVSPDLQFKLEELGLNDILVDAPSYFEDLTNIEDFCRDIVNSFDRIEYSDYRMRLHRKYKRNQVESLQ